VPGRTITWSPALTAFLAAALMVHSGVAEVPGPVSLHSEGLLLWTHHTPAASAVGAATVATPKMRVKTPKMPIRRERTWLAPWVQ
jgi:hypothetical protein